MPNPNRNLQLLFRPEIRDMAAYTVADAGDHIKLDAMENPYSWPPEMVDAWLSALRQCQPNRYPDPSADSLKQVLRACNAVPKGSDILLGNGSDELIQILLMAVAGPDATVLAPEPSFVMYRQIANSLGIRYTAVPLLAETFQLDMAEMGKALTEHRPKVVFLAYPNNPTGNLFASDDLLEILKLAPGLVVIDEAYAPFAGSSFMERLPEHDNLLVMRTVSKLGLAGLRLGLLAATPALIAELDKLRLPYNINILTQKSAEFALSHYSVFEDQTRRIRDDREQLFASLQAIKGVTPFPSRANFILFRCAGHSADAVFRELKRAGILIKNLSAAGGPLADCLRVTVGTQDENRAFITALEKIISS